MSALHPPYRWCGRFYSWDDWFFRAGPIGLSVRHNPGTPIFTERYGIRRSWRVGKWCFGWLGVGEIRKPAALERWYERHEWKHIHEGLTEVRHSHAGPRSHQHLEEMAS